MPRVALCENQPAFTPRARFIVERNFWYQRSTVSLCERQSDKSPEPSFLGLSRFFRERRLCRDSFRLIKYARPAHGLPLISTVSTKRAVSFVGLIFVLTRKTFDTVPSSIVAIFCPVFFLPRSYLVRRDKRGLSSKICHGCSAT